MRNKKYVLHIKAFNSSAFMFASIDAFKFGDDARYLDIRLKPAV